MSNHARTRDGSVSSRRRGGAPTGGHVSLRSALTSSQGMVLCLAISARAAWVASMATRSFAASVRRSRSSASAQSQPATSPLR